MLERAIEVCITVWWKVQTVKRRKYWKEWCDASAAREQEKMSTLGPYDPTKDDRIMAVECQEETYDIKSYLRFFRRKRPDLAEKADAAERLAFECYCGLRELELLEREDPE